VWFGILIGLSVVWRNKIDGMSINVGKTLEKTMTEKKPLFNGNPLRLTTDVEESTKIIAKDVV